MKKILSALAVLGLSIAIVIAPNGQTPAVGDVIVPTIPPSAPAPVNIVPSVLKAAKPAGTYFEYTAILLREFAKGPSYWQAVSAKQGGTASPSQLATVAAQESQFKVPATKPAPLLKLAGNALSALGAGSMGLWIGDTFSRAVLGFEDGKVCAMNNSVLSTIASFTNGVDCGAWALSLAAEFKNADAFAGTSGPITCRPTVGSTPSTMPMGNCIQMIGTTTRVGFGGSITNIQCFQLSGTAGSAWGDFFFSTTGTTWANTALFSTGDSADRCRAVFGSTPAKVAWQPSSLPGPLWYKLGNTGTPKQAVVSDGNPWRTNKCTINLVGGGSVSGPATAQYRENGSTATPVAQCPDLAEGQIPSGVQFTQGGPGLDDRVLSSQEVTPEYQEFREEYPECSTGTCMLDLKGPDGVSCFVVQTGCVSWFQDPARDENFTCEYGGHSVPIAECYLYAPTFTPQAQSTGNVYGDPETGAAVDTQTALGRETQSGVWANGVQDPDANRVCYPQGWAVLNPVEWVVKPVQCALEWAFVPRQSVVTNSANAIQTAVNGSILGDSAAIVNSLKAPFMSAGSSCQGPPFHLVIDFGGGEGMDETYYPLSACSAPMSTVAALFNSISQGIVLMLSLAAALRYFGSIFGFVGFGALRANQGGSGVTFKGGDS